MVEKKLVEAQNMSQKDEEEDQQTHNQLIKYHLLKNNHQTGNPKHDTDWDQSKSKAHWNKKNKGYVVDQLYKRNWKWPRHPNGKKPTPFTRFKKNHYGHDRYLVD